MSFRDFKRLRRTRQYAKLYVRDDFSEEPSAVDVDIASSALSSVTIAVIVERVETFNASSYSASKQSARNAIFFYFFKLEKRRISVRVFSFPFRFVFGRVSCRPEMQ